MRRAYLRIGQKAFCVGQGSEEQREGEGKWRVGGGEVKWKGGCRNATDTGKTFVQVAKTSAEFLDPCWF